MAAILQLVKSSCLNGKSSDFDEIWYTNANLELGDSQMTKYENFATINMVNKDLQNSRWRTAAILKACEYT